MQLLLFSAYVREAGKDGVSKTSMLYMVHKSMVCFVLILLMFEGL